MITVDCKDVESILHELAIYVSDQVVAMPAMKLHQFVLAPIVDDEPVDQAKVITAVKEFLQSIGEKSNFGVISNGDYVVIKSNSRTSDTSDFDMMSSVAVILHFVGTSLLFLPNIPTLKHF